ncbi:MAG: hypothetical protein OXN84_00495 [Albidovulum sp.]|nr:hypothetical protein [Albidovulum sp.]
MLDAEQWPASAATSSGGIEALQRSMKSWRKLYSVSASRRISGATRWRRLLILSCQFVQPRRVVAAAREASIVAQ